MGRLIKRLILVFVVLVLAGAAGVTGAWMGSPSFRELVLIAGLGSGVEEVQRASADALRDYPSERAALALIAFVNLVHQPPFDVSRWRETARDPATAPDELVTEMAAMLEGWGCLEANAGAEGFRRLDDGDRRAALDCADDAIRAADAVREERNEVAERGMLSLCILTGHDFGTYYEPGDHGYSWGSLSDDAWFRSLDALNGWAFETFGPEYLAAAAAGLVGAQP
jgi:hypothetical protein